MSELPALRQVSYERHEALGRGHTLHTASLLTFVYDIPHFDACGIFPPLHIANQIFITGKAGSGMGPGTTWEPFIISEEEYRGLVEAVRGTPVSEIASQARFAFVVMKFDPSFDHIEERREWFQAACNKHRSTWHEELERAGATF